MIDFNSSCTQTELLELQMLAKSFWILIKVTLNITHYYYDKGKRI